MKFKKEYLLSIIILLFFILCFSENNKNTTSTTTANFSDKTIIISNKSNSANTYYILNTNSMKFHYSSCFSSAQISDKNRAEFNGTRDKVIAKGYDPCGNCDP